MNFAFYGTLRKGGRLYARLEGDKNFLIKGTGRIAGYQMHYYPDGGYPGVVRGANEITVEFVEAADPKISQRIIYFEKNYEQQAVEFGGEQYILFVATQNGETWWNRQPPVESGDYIAHLQSKTKKKRKNKPPPALT